mgnify:CR=1 FL=1
MKLSLEYGSRSIETAHVGKSIILAIKDLDGIGPVVFLSREEANTLIEAIRNHLTKIS